MDIRMASKDDDLGAIAGLIYQTDPYIFPAAFYSEALARKLLPKMFLSSGNVFCIENICVAVEKQVPVGIAIVLPGNYNQTFDYEKFAHDNKAPDLFIYTAKKYFVPLTSYVQSEDQVYISCICVHQSLRGNGIGEQLLSYVIERNKDKEQLLHVLSDNVNAIDLYKKVGFRILKQEPGFSLDENKPSCYLMRRDNYFEKG